MRRGGEVHESSSWGERRCGKAAREGRGALMFHFAQTSLHFCCIYPMKYVWSQVLPDSAHCDCQGNGRKRVVSLQWVTQSCHKNVENRLLLLFQLSLAALPRKTTLVKDPLHYTFGWIMGTRALLYLSGQSLYPDKDLSSLNTLGNL